MIYSVLMREDGLLAQPQATLYPCTPPDQAARLAQFLAASAGIFDDPRRGGWSWSYQEMDAETFSAALAMIATGGAAYWRHGKIHATAPPRLTCDREGVPDDGTTPVRLICAVEGADDGQPLAWEIRAPDGQVYTCQDVIHGGAATLELTTGQRGTHDILLVLPGYGQARLSVEAVNSLWES